MEGNFNQIKQRAYHLYENDLQNNLLQRSEKEYFNLACKIHEMISEGKGDDVTPEKCEICGLRNPTIEYHCEHEVCGVCFAESGYCTFCSQTISDPLGSFFQREFETRKISIHSDSDGDGDDCSPFCDDYVSPFCDRCNEEPSNCHCFRGWCEGCDQDQRDCIC